MTLSFLSVLHRFCWVCNRIKLFTGTDFNTPSSFSVTKYFYTRLQQLLAYAASRFHSSDSWTSLTEPTLWCRARLKKLVISSAGREIPGVWRNLMVHCRRHNQLTRRGHHNRTCDFSERVISLKQTVFDSEVWVSTFLSNADGPLIALSTVTNPLVQAQRSCCKWRNPYVIYTARNPGPGLENNIVAVWLAR
jgi:hypothetical protein